ncbi:hypothetical protein ACU4GD_14145 [Cupriavidus basilensis]
MPSRTATRNCGRCARFSARKAGTSGSLPRRLAERPVADATDSLAFFRYLNFMLQFAPTVPSEQDVMARFAKIPVWAAACRSTKARYRQEYRRPYGGRHG